ncbi:DoxX family protein [Hymenobacter sp. BT186]|uniref:DoxX family protein n=1 Tax=Hymenobacter telluris TaxID=2816474 RepID=A0A939JAA2_9BACT|nr:DoxX family protein [Hymenobacter telluris]MBO0357881.1 DoxX family protein [Hymenobacter telluris]MBW3373908.1 DoxX family protein [Hymenobacter norwichensis]
MAFSKKTVLPLLVTAVPALMVTASGIMKLLGTTEIRQALAAAGVADYRIGLGLMELLFTALFLYPRTMKLGLLLLTSYFAGAIATDLSHGHSLVAPVLILTLVWIAAFLRDRSAFLPTAEQAA